MAFEGRPVVFPQSREVSEPSLKRAVKEMVVLNVKATAMQMLARGQFEKLYYFLMDLKLLKELGLHMKSEDYDRALRSLGLE